MILFTAQRIVNHNIEFISIASNHIVSSRHNLDQRNCGSSESWMVDRVMEVFILELIGFVFPNDFENSCSWLCRSITVVATVGALDP